MQTVLLSRTMASRAGGSWSKSSDRTAHRLHARADPDRLTRWLAHYDVDASPPGDRRRTGRGSPI